MKRIISIFNLSWQIKWEWIYNNGRRPVSQLPVKAQVISFVYYTDRLGLLSWPNNCRKIFPPLFSIQYPLHWLAYHATDSSIYPSCLCLFFSQIKKNDPKNDILFFPKNEMYWEFQKMLDVALPDWICSLAI